LIRREKKWRDALRRNSKIGVRIRKRGKFLLLRLIFSR